MTNINNNMLLKLEELVSFLKQNPMWILGFVDGEGCFTSSIIINPRSTWGLQPQVEFNITQSSDDITLLHALNTFFNDLGNIYNKPNNVSVLVFRKVDIILSLIIPFFTQYPLITLKVLAFNTWVLIVNILASKQHVGSTLEARDHMVKLAILMKDLNSRWAGSKKAEKYDLMIKWLNGLSEVPSLEEKLQFKALMDSKKY